MPGELLAPLAGSLTRLSMRGCHALGPGTVGGLQRLTRLRSLDLSSADRLTDVGSIVRLWFMQGSFNQGLLPGDEQLSLNFLARNPPHRIAGLHRSQIDPMVWHIRADAGLQRHCRPGAAGAAGGLPARPGPAELRRQPR